MSEEEIPEWIPKHIQMQKPFPLWYTKFRYVCTYRAFVSAFELIRLGYLTDMFMGVGRDIIRTETSEMFMIGTIKSVNKEFVEENYSFLISADNPLKCAVCQCEDYLYTHSLCKHIIAGFIYSLDHFKLTNVKEALDRTEFRKSPKWLDSRGQPILEMIL